MKRKQEILYRIPRNVGDGVIETIYPYDTPFKPVGRSDYASRWGSYPVVKPEGGYVVEAMDVATGRMVKKLYTNVPRKWMEFLSGTDNREVLSQRYVEEHKDWRDKPSQKDENGDWHYGAMDIAAYELYTREKNQPEEEEEYPEEQLCGMLSSNPKIRNAQVRYMRGIVRKALPFLTKKSLQTFYQLFNQCLREVDIARADGVEKSAVANRKKRLIEQIVPVFESLGFIIPTKEELAAEKKAAEERADRLKKELSAKRKEEREMKLIRRLTEIFYSGGLLDEATKVEIDEELDEVA